MVLCAGAVQHRRAKGGFLLDFRSLPKVAFQSDFATLAEYQTVAVDWLPVTGSKHLINDIERTSLHFVKDRAQIFSNNP